MSSEGQPSMEDVIRKDGRYPVEAFAFLHEGLSKAVAEVHGAQPPEGSQRHVTGAQLCHSLKALAVEKWGLLAEAVLAKWNLHATIDFGEMVYLLISHNYMRKTEEDSLEDFRDVFNFEEAFRSMDDFEIKE